MKEISAPDEFKKLLLCLFDFRAGEGKTIGQHLAEHARTLPRKDKDALRMFLDVLLNGKHTPAELKRVWKHAPDPNYMPIPGGGSATMKALREIRQALDDK